jgi:hypothetical protein
MSERRGPWYLITGVILGIIAGILYGWLASPVSYFDTSPRTLRVDFKDQYRVVIALAYQADDDFGRAKARLALLVDTDPIAALAGQAQRYLGEGKAVEASALAELAGDLKNPPPPIIVTPTLVPSATPTLDANALTPSPTTDPNSGVWTATPTFTPVFTLTPQPTQPLLPTLGAPFNLVDSLKDCDPALGRAMLKFEVLNAAGEPVPGVRILVTWEGGQSFFYTGLSPQISQGYSDFEMSPDITYTAQVGDGGGLATGLVAQSCTADNGAPYPGGWWLRFKQ